MYFKLTRTYTIVLALVIALVGLLGVWLKFLYTPLVTDPKGLRYVVREGATLNAVIEDLYHRRIIQHPGFFKILIKTKRIAHELKAGEYLFQNGTRPTKLLDQLVTGNGLIYHSFTIIPGKTFKEIRVKLTANESLKHTIELLPDIAIMQRLGHPELKPEGEFFPDTYFFLEGDEDIVILKKALKAMQEKLNKAWQTRQADLPFKNAYEVLIAASIIEKEAYLEEELPVMAGVMVNRLKKGMLLQFDPTVIYGVGESYTGKIRRSDLLNNNPYNTYLRKGLPPTPICMPSLAAIQAATHPSKHDYYYFVAKPDRSSQFTKKLDEHHKAVEEAQKIKTFFNSNLAGFYLVRLFDTEIYPFFTE